jgi:amino-acid N-acetyltransferase
MARITQAADRRPEIVALLQAASLPFEDIEPHLENFLVALDADRVVGVIGLELLGPDALLRSLAVAGDLQGRGIGNQLVDEALAHANRRAVRSLYLMTTTAEEFFARRGFALVDRATVEPVLKNTREWRELCPASAVVMHRALRF